MELTPKQIHKAVSNYLVNELGVDKAYIENIVKQQLDKIDIANIAQQELNQCMLQTTRDGFNAAAIIRRHIDRLVDEELLARMKSGEMTQICQADKQNLLSVVTLQTFRTDIKYMAEIWGQNRLLCVFKITDQNELNIQWHDETAIQDDNIWAIMRSRLTEKINESR